MDNLTSTPKTIIYLDQFVISNITKLLDPEFPLRARVLKDPFLLEPFMDVVTQRKKSREKGQK